MAALIEAPEERRDVEKIDPGCKGIPDREKTLTELTRKYCILIAKGTDDQYYVEALTSSVINYERKYIFKFFR